MPLQQQYIIGVIIDFHISDPKLCETFMDISRNSKDARFLPAINNFFNATSRLKFNFSECPLRFYRNNMISDDILKQHVLPLCQGIIINIAGRGLDVNYLASNDIFVSMMKKYVRCVYESNLPTIFAIEDVEGSSTPIYIPIREEVINTELTAVDFKTEPASNLTLNQDIWDTNSITLKNIRSILNIPKKIPLLPYSHRKPASIENLLITLISKIEEE